MPSSVLKMRMAFIENNDMLGAILFVVPSPQCSLLTWAY